MKNKKSLFLMALILITTTIFAGCSKKGEDAKKNPNSSATSSQENEEPSYGGSIVVGITQDLDSLDPHKAVAAGTREVLCNIFDGLVNADKDGNLVPAVASKYEISPDAKNIHLH